MKSVRTCPVCGRKYTESPALSRRDNETEICSSCGLEEALMDFYSSKLEVSQDSLKNI